MEKLITRKEAAEILGISIATLDAARTTQKVDHFLHISITDEGTGFTSEAIHHAQEQFFMGDKSRTSNMHFGMGLYITNSIIKQHGGQLVLSNSKKTGGAQVIIKIPY